MNKFTINELDIIINCINHRQYYLTHIKTDSEKRKLDIAQQYCLLEHLEQKCIKQKIDLGFGQELLDDKIRREYPLKECV